MIGSFVSSYAVATSKVTNEIRQIYKRSMGIVNQKPKDLIILNIEASAIGKEFSYSILKNGEKPTSSGSFKVLIYKNKIIQLTEYLEGADAVNRAESYFYDSGKLAFHFESFLAFNGFNVDKQVVVEGTHIIEKRRYFNNDGKMVKSLSKAYNLKTKKPVKEEWFKSVYPSEVFKTIKSLPFYNMLYPYFNKVKK